MNLDCHYYGTYFIARQAGWVHEDAQKIAWAAETVDQATISKLTEVYKNSTDGEKIPLVTTIIEPTKGMQHTQTYTYAYRYWIMFSWMPFHFLPELPSLVGEPPSLEKNPLYTSNNINYDDKELEDFEKAHVKYSEYIYKEDYKQICKTTTTLCKEMIIEVKKLYQDYVGSCPQEQCQTVVDCNGVSYPGTSLELMKDRALFRIGICMHVLADTWSHQGFCGNGDIFVNYAKKIDSSQWDSTDSTKFWWADALAVRDKDVFSSYWCGHGSLQHNPDIPGSDYTYIHPYSKRTIEVKNTIRFLNAFYQMYNSLRYILNPNETNLELDVGENNEYTNTVFGKIPVNKKGESLTLYNILNNIFVNSKDYEDEDGDKKCKNWKELLCDVYGKDKYCPTYSLTKKINGKNSYENLKVFLSQAEEHRNFIMKKMGYANKINTIEQIVESILKEGSTKNVNIDSNGNELDDESKSFRVDIKDINDNITTYIFYGKEAKIKEFDKRNYYYAFFLDTDNSLQPKETEINSGNGTETMVASTPSEQGASNGNNTEKDSNTAVVANNSITQQPNSDNYNPIGNVYTNGLEKAMGWT